mmetsp:Transcript_355/g.1230  ORF Transcript_355/g.1230 Transcript_355/m.1230 type:complete len:344 (+) Transcript_355:282-1313(+)
MVWIAVCTRPRAACAAFARECGLCQHSTPSSPPSSPPRLHVRCTHLSPCESSHGRPAAGQRARHRPGLRERPGAAVAAPPTRRGAELPRCGREFSAAAQPRARTRPLTCRTPMAAAPLPQRTRKRRDRPGAAAGASAPWSRPACKYEYLDHTADVQLHAWGSTLEEALGQAVVAMTGYMTDVNTVHPGAGGDAVLTVEAGDLLGLVYRLLDEALFRFNGDGMLICDAVVESLAIGGGLPARAVRADESSPPASGTAARLTCRVRGEAFSRDRHPCGTEIKAITYSQMTVQPPLPPGAAERTEAGPATAGPSRPATGGLDDDRPYAEHAKWRPDEWHLFVIVDI